MTFNSWLKLRFLSFSHSFCVVGRSHNTLLFLICLQTLDVTDPRNHVTILGGFIVNNPEWLVHSCDTSVMRCEAEQFSQVNNLSELTNRSTGTLDRTSNSARFLDFILTSIHSLQLNISVLSLFASSDHCHYIICQLHPRNPVPSSRDTFWCYDSVNWDGFRDFLGAHQWKDLLLHRTFQTLLTSFFKIRIFLFHNFPNQANPIPTSGLVTHAVVLEKLNILPVALLPTPASQHGFM